MLTSPARSASHEPSLSQPASMRVRLLLLASTQTFVCELKSELPVDLGLVHGVGITMWLEAS